MLITIELSHNNFIHILNIYNDAKDHSMLFNHIISLIQTHSHQLPESIHCLGGNFNLHSDEWDPSWGMLSLLEVLTKLYFIIGYWGLRLLSPPDVPTHLPHNTHLHGSVIDLIWVPEDIPSNCYIIDVDIFG